MRPNDPLCDLSADISTLRQAVDHVTQQAQQFAERYQKNSGFQECLLFLHRALTSISDEDELWPDSALNIDWIQFGKTLKRRRQQAHLGQKEIAELAEVSEPMIRFIEAARKRPSRKLLLRLLALPALNMHLDDVIGTNNQPCVIPTLWMSPEYDPRQLITALVERLNGSGCSLEQTTAYLDATSALDWLATCSTPNYTALFSNTEAMETVARQIADQCGAGGVDVIALGSGDARREVRLVECLLEHTARRNIKDIRVFLLDISHMLLTEGHKYATAKIGSSVKNLFALHGNFHELAQYPLFGQGDLRSRCRVFTLFGGTMANLDNEVRFFRDTMSAAVPGDFFVTDYANTYAPADEPDRIRELDPPLHTGVLPAHKTWLSGSLLRHTKGVRAVDISIELNTDCTVRGSYELVFVANVTMDKGIPNRRFVVWRVRRYDPALLEECLGRTGWATEMRIPYGANERSNLTLALLRKSA